MAIQTVSCSWKPKVLFVLGALASAQVQAAEITVFNHGIQTILDTAWGRLGVLAATLAIVVFGYRLLSGHLDVSYALKIILGILVIWGAVEIFSAFGT